MSKDSTCFVLFITYHLSFYAETPPIWCPSKTAFSEVINPKNALEINPILGSHWNLGEFLVDILISKIHPSPSRNYGEICFKRDWTLQYIHKPKRIWFALEIRLCSDVLYSPACIRTRIQFLAPINAINYQSNRHPNNHCHLLSRNKRIPWTKTLATRALVTAVCFRATTVPMDATIFQEHPRGWYRWCRPLTMSVMSSGWKEIKVATTAQQSYAGRGVSSWCMDVAWIYWWL